MKRLMPVVALACCCLPLGACNRKPASPLTVKDEAAPPKEEKALDGPNTSVAPPQLTPVEKARKRALSLDAEILSIKRQGVNVEYRIAKAKYADALQALEDGAVSGDEHQANENAAEEARQATIDAWLATNTELSDIAVERDINRVRRVGRSVEVGIAQARLDSAKRALNDGDRAAAEKRKSGPLSLPEPADPPEPTPLSEETLDRPRITEATPQPSLAASPAAMSTSAVPTGSFADEVKESQARALKKYPDLGVAGSPLNASFVAAYRGLQANRDPLLQDPDWPEALAERSAISVAISSR